MNETTWERERCAVCTRVIGYRTVRFSAPAKWTCTGCYRRFHELEMGAKHLRAFPSVRTNGEVRTPQTDDGFYGCYSD